MNPVNLKHKFSRQRLYKGDSLASSHPQTYLHSFFFQMSADKDNLKDGRYIYSLLIFFI